jgi:hypothetical protein
LNQLNTLAILNPLAIIPPNATSKQERNPTNQPPPEALQEPTNQAQPNHQNHSHKGREATARTKKNGVPSARKSQPQKTNGLVGTGWTLKDLQV